MHAIGVIRRLAAEFSDACSNLGKLVEGQRTVIDWHEAQTNIANQLAEGQRALFQAADNLQKQLAEGHLAHIQAADNIQKQLAAIIARMSVETSVPAPIAAAPIAVDPIVDVRFPSVDMTAGNPVAAITQAPDFAATVQFFAINPATERALLSPNAQALLYCLLRNMKPEHVIEIGTYRASTTEALCRALHQNGGGTVHTIDPFGGDTVPGIIAQWPPELRARSAFYGVNSMAFFAGFRSAADVVLVDGDHDFEFALFDIQAAARIVRPRGFIVVDNISQPGPFFAALEFVKAHPEWTEMGSTLSGYRNGHPFDRHRVTLTNTDFLILRAPSYLVVGATPFTTGAVEMPELRAVSLSPANGAIGTVDVQCVLRTFTDPPMEITATAAIALDGKGGEATFTFDPPLRPEKPGARFTVEPWLTWDSSLPLNLKGPPLLS